MHKMLHPCLLSLIPPPPAILPVALHGFEPEDGRLSPETTTGGACPGSGCWLLTGRKPHLRGAMTGVEGGRASGLAAEQSRLCRAGRGAPGSQLTPAPVLRLQQSLTFATAQRPLRCSPQRSNLLWGWRPSVQGKSQQEGSHTQPCPVPGGASPLRHTGAGISSSTAPAPAFRCDAATSASSASCDRGRLQTAALPREVGQLL